MIKTIKITYIKYNKIKEKTVVSGMNEIMQSVNYSGEYIMPDEIIKIEVMPEAN